MSTSPTARTVSAAPPLRRTSRARRALRVTLGVVFLLSGLPKLLDHATWAADFARWNVPLPDAAAFAVGGFEVLGGLMLAFGMATRPLATLFAAQMVAALLFAGTSDGGQHLVLPLILGATTSVMAIRGRRA